MGYWPYFFLVVGIPLLSLIISLFFNRNKTDIDTIFSAILGLMFITELTGFALAYFRVQNFVVYNIYCLVFALMNYYLFSKLTRRARMKKAIKYLSVFVLIVFLADSILNKSLLTSQQHITYFLSLLILIYIIAMHLIEIMKSEAIIDFHRSKSFWISLGLLLFSVPFLPVIFALDFLNAVFEVRWRINLLLIVIMHSCFITALLWTKNR